MASEVEAAFRSANQCMREIRELLDGMEKPEFKTERDADEYMQILLPDLQPGKPLRSKITGIQRSIVAVEEGIAYFKAGDPIKIAALIANFLTDLRVDLQRYGLMYIISVSRVLQSDFSPSMQILFPMALRLLLSRNSQIANIAHCAILESIKSTQTIETAYLIPSHCTAVPIAQAVAECCHIIIETWPTGTVTKLWAQIDSFLSDASLFAQSPIPETIQSAREMMSIESDVSSTRSRRKKKSSLQILPLAIEISKIPKPRFAAAEEEEAQEKVSFYPIDSAEKASAFVGYINSESFSVPDRFGDLLVQSISFQPDFDLWRPTIFRLFEENSRPLAPSSTSILRSFQFNEDLFQKLIIMYGADRLIENVVKTMQPSSKAAFDFFIRLFALIPRILLTETQKKYLNSLILAHKTNEKIGIIESRMGCDFQCFIDTLSTKIASGKVNAEDGAQVVDLFEREKLSNEEDVTKNLNQCFDVVLPAAVMKPSPLGVFAFIEAMAEKIGKVSFTRAVEPLFQRIYKGGSEELIDKGTSLLAKIAGDPDSLAVVLAILKDSKEMRSEAFKVLMLHCSQIPPKRLSLRRKPIVRTVVPFLSSDQKGDRQSALEILVVMYKRIPREFSKQLAKLPPSKARLITLKASTEQ